MGEVQEWDPTKPKTDLITETEKSSLVPIPENEDSALLETNLSKIDQMEQEYLREYYLIKEKDKAAGKDFNKVAHDEMVRAQFDFDQMRKFEREKHQ